MLSEIRTRATHGSAFQVHSSHKRVAGASKPDDDSFRFISPIFRPSRLFVPSARLTRQGRRRDGGRSVSPDTHPHTCSIGGAADPIAGDAGRESEERAHLLRQPARPHVPCLLPEAKLAAGEMTGCKTCFCQPVARCLHRDAEGRSFDFERDAASLHRTHEAGVRTISTTWQAVWLGIEQMCGDTRPATPGVAPRCGLPRAARRFLRQPPPPSPGCLRCRLNGSRAMTRTRTSNVFPSRLPLREWQGASSGPSPLVNPTTAPCRPVPDEGEASVHRFTEADASHYASCAVV